MYQDQQHRASARSDEQGISVMLEVQGEEAQGAMRLPVSIHNVHRGQLVLRLSLTLPEFMRESLVNLTANLYLAVPEEQEIVEASGKVAWLKTSNRGHFQTLALELSQPLPKLQQLLRKHLVHIPADIKELWERWDQVNDRALAGEPLNYHVGLALMVSGIGLNLAGPKSSFTLVSYLLMLLGGLVAGFKNVLPLRWSGARSV